MCGILFTTKNITDIDYVIEFLKKRGPDKTNIKIINNYTFIHTLLSMTGYIEQPIINNDIIVIFNGEIYNFEEFDINYKSDSECIIPLYKKYGDDFINLLDGEFAIVLVDINKNKLILSTDIFGTKPLWFGYDNDNNIGISSYKSCLDRIELTNNFQISANKTIIFDLIKLKIIKEKPVHIFDLKQFKTDFNDWNIAFEKSIKKRIKNSKSGIFIGLSAGYDSGTIACELNKQKIPFTAYCIINSESKDIINKRSNLIKNFNILNISKEKLLEEREFIKKNCEDYLLNLNNGDINNYYNIIKQPKYNKTKVNQLLNNINYKKNQLLSDDTGSIGSSHIFSLAVNNNSKIYLSGAGADEIFSDYGFNKVKFYNQSSIGGYFTDDLNKIFPWRNFFENTQRAYLIKDDYIAGMHGIEGRYPFLDKYVVQEFLWLTNKLKNEKYKAPLYNYLIINNFPFEENQKIGFNCGHSCINKNDLSYNTLTNNEIEIKINKKVSEYNSNMIVNFDNYNKHSYNNHCFLDKKQIKKINNNLYFYPISINDFGFKYKDFCNYYIIENNKKIGKSEININIISNIGKGLYCFWTSSCLYFSSSDNSDPRINKYTYCIDMD